MKGYRTTIVGNILVTVFAQHCKNPSENVGFIFIK